MCPFVGSLVPLVWTSGDVCPRFLGGLSLDLFGTIPIGIFVNFG